MRISAPPRTTLLPMLALMFGAASWGILWYPYRLLEADGMSAPVASALSYLVAMLIGVALFPRAWREIPPHWGWLLALALASGFTNVAYLVAVMKADVVRIVLLFYLAPLWTVPLAWLLLREQLTLAAAATVVLALAGALVILWRPELGLPAPRNVHEWLGLIAGVAFALSNVLVKRAHAVSAGVKSLCIAAGVVLVSIPVAFASGESSASAATWRQGNLLLLTGIGALVMATSLTLQYGLARMPANRASVILLFELVVAAAAAHWLAGEVASVQDWVGGAMIVLAGLISGCWPAPKPHKDAVL